MRMTMKVVIVDESFVTSASYNEIELLRTKAGPLSPLYSEKVYRKQV
jgi:hypothetical protein